MEAHFQMIKKSQEPWLQTAQSVLRWATREAKEELAEPSERGLLGRQQTRMFQSRLQGAREVSGSLWFGTHFIRAGITWPGTETWLVG